MLTLNDIYFWIKDNEDRLDKERTECKDESIVFLNRLAPAKCKELWDTGEWLAHTLKENSCPQEEVREITFMHGQRCFTRNAHEDAVELANEYINTGTTKDKPGLDLAKKINKEAGIG